MTPTARTLAFLRAAGFVSEVVEKWNPHSKTRHDLYSCIDVICLRPGEQGLLGVQATSGTNHAARVQKILAEPKARLWIEAGQRLWVISWQKRGARGKRKVWEPRVEKIEIGMFEGAA